MDIKTDTTKKYGILLSGGIDSAILLYLLIKSNPSINIQPFTIDKTDGAGLYANPIVDHLNRKFDLSIPHTIFVGDPKVHHRMQSTTAVIDIFTKHTDIDLLFVGINRNPPELADDPHAPKRDTKSTHPRIIFPFVDLYKDAVLQMVYDNDQQDLLDLTHTCTEQSHGRCNQCWQCRERIWAFKQLDRIDTGLL
jgi:3'-phosphoadenosine 5'-phosphosulfate sulfotransferase (PAPS reductase)/FAD synthetase